MRLWHKDLLPVLPRQQLLSQWRECCCITKNIADKGIPNHILVNKIMNYSDLDFYYYTRQVVEEIERRGYTISDRAYSNWKANMHKAKDKFLIKGVLSFPIYKDWHNDRYLQQCLFNLDEKHNCQGIPDEEWNKILKKYRKELDYE